MKIITLTLNPAFDVHCYVKDFAPYHENLATVTHRDAGGKGVNISKALTANGVENLAFVVVGDENGDSFLKCLEANRLSCKVLKVSGRIRENITIHTNGADETRISFEGFKATNALLSDVLAALDGKGLNGAFVTFTGRVPSGVDMWAVKQFLKELADKGAKIIIDSKSFSLDDIIEVRPYLIKPNGEEISEYLGREIRELSETKAVAEELNRKGIENVMISLGAEGALLATFSTDSAESSVYVATPPKIDAISTIGAGDSSIGGFLAAVSEGKSTKDALRLAVSYGTAACLTQGTSAPKSEDIKEIYSKIKISIL